MELAEGQVKFMEGDISPVACVAERLDKVQKETYRDGQSQKEESASVQRSEWKPYFRYNRKHDREKCPVKGWKCFRCENFGHTSRVCKSSNVNAVMNEESNHEEEDEDNLVLGFLSSLEAARGEPEKVKLNVEGKTVIFEIDSGACRSVIHFDDFSKYFSELNFILLSII